MGIEAKQIRNSEPLNCEVYYSVLIRVQSCRAHEAKRSDRRVVVAHLNHEMIVFAGLRMHYFLVVSILHTSFIIEIDIARSLSSFVIATKLATSLGVVGTP